LTVLAAGSPLYFRASSLPVHYKFFCLEASALTENKELPVDPRDFNSRDIVMVRDAGHRILLAGSIQQSIAATVLALIEERFPLLV
jgi:hypothetical protein